MFDNNPALTASFSFPADWNAVAAALAATRDFIASAPCGADAEARLAIIVEELVANLVEHGTCSPDSNIGLELAALGKDVGLTLSDEAVPFDSRLATAPAQIPPERGGGAGLALVRAWAQIISYERIDGRNLLRLVIRDHG